MATGDQALPQKPLLTIKNNYVLQKLESILNDETFKDITIVCKDGTAFRAHKVIVAKYSSVLKDMINSKRKAAAVRINLNDLDSEQRWEPWMIEIILDFMYGKVIKLTVGDLKPVINVAVKLNIPEFLLACQGIMSMDEMIRNKDMDIESCTTKCNSSVDTPKYIKVEPVAEVTEILPDTYKGKGLEPVEQQQQQQCNSILEDSSDNNKADNSHGFENNSDVTDGNDMANDENESDGANEDTFEGCYEEPERKITANSPSEKCKLCGEETASKAKLANHLLETHDLSACPICLKMFENQLYLDKHKETHTKKGGNKSKKKKPPSSAFKTELSLGEKAYLCSECDGQLSSYEELAIHLTEVHELIACTFCAKVFNSVGHMGRHRVLHSEKILVADEGGHFLYSCHHCQDMNGKLQDDQFKANTTFSNVSEFYKHQDREHGGLSCRICGAKKAKLIRLCDHMLTSHIKEYLFACDECDRHFATLESLNKHKLYHKESKTPAKAMESICEHCGRCFKSQKGMDAHIEEKHTPVKDFECSECKKLFSTETLHLAHMKKRHSEVKFMCDECGKSFYRQGLLHAHISTVHRPEVLKTKCEHCGTEFPKNLLRLRHIRRTPECRKALNMYNIQCKVCEKKFCRQIDLDMHMDKIHSGEDFVCDECGRKCPTLVRLKKHKKEHLRLHQCAVCSKRFGDRKHLVEHERIHTGVKPYKCMDCGRAFTQSGSLYKHKQTHSHKIGVQRNQNLDQNLANTLVPVDNQSRPLAGDEINIIIPAENDGRAQSEFVEFVQLLSVTQPEIK